MSGPIAFRTAATSPYGTNVTGTPSCAANGARNDGAKPSAASGPYESPW